MNILILHNSLNGQGIKIGSAAATSSINSKDEHEDSFVM